MNIWNNNIFSIDIQDEFETDLKRRNDKEEEKVHLLTFHIISMQLTIIKKRVDKMGCSCDVTDIDFLKYQEESVSNSIVPEMLS